MKASENATRESIQTEILDRQTDRQTNTQTDRYKITQVRTIYNRSGKENKDEGRKD